MSTEAKKDRKPRAGRATLAQRIAKHDAAIARHLARAEKEQAARRKLVADERARVEVLNEALERAEEGGQS